jgi:hypothetical protein
MNTVLKNLEAIKDKVGYRPKSFHDAEIISISLDRRGPSISLSLLMDQHQGSDDTRPAPRWEVVLRFEDIGNLILQDFNHQNVVSSLLLSPVTEERFNVRKGRAESQSRIEFCVRCRR